MPQVSACKHRQPEQRSFGPESRSWLQSSVALKVRWRGAARPAAPLSTSTRETSPLGYLLHSQRSHSGGGELYGQRYPVQLPADPRHSSRVLLGEPEVGQPQAGAIDEEPEPLRSARGSTVDSIRRGR